MGILALDSELLAGLDDDTVESVISAARVRHTRSNEQLITQGDPTARIFLIKKGYARFYKLNRNGEDTMLLWLVPGDIVGLGALLAKQAFYLVSAETMSPCELLVWSRSRIRSLAAVHPRIMENGLELSLSYLKYSLQRHADLSSEPPETRIARSLLQLAVKVGRLHKSGVEIKINNERLSSLADISTFTASRILAEWRRAGKVSKERGRVILHAPDTLIQ